VPVLNFDFLLTSSGLRAAFVLRLRLLFIDQVDELILHHAVGLTGRVYSEAVDPIFAAIPSTGDHQATLVQVLLRFGA